MGKTLFVSTYYNNPAFMGLQLACLREFVRGEWDFRVVNDAGDDTRCLFSGAAATVEIEREAERLRLVCERVPQGVHENESRGGLVPDGLPASHPTERHRACLHWIFKNHKRLGFDGYDHFVLMESDMFFAKEVNAREYFSGHDITAPMRKGCELVRTGDPDQYWPERIKGVERITVDFFPMYFFAVDMRVVKNLETINIGGFAGTDTGGQTCFFLEDNPGYTVFPMLMSDTREYQVQFISKTRPDESAEIIHYRAGSNWDCQSKDYYDEKLERLFEAFIPGVKTRSTAATTVELKSRDGQHSFLPKNRVSS
jgi:hypothetical protein